MKTDKQIHALLASGPEAFRFLTDGIELPGPYQGRSVAFKKLELSALADRFVKDPREVVKAGEVVKVKVLEVDLKRQRIALTMRLSEPATGAPAQKAENAQRPERRERGPRPPAPPEKLENRPSALAEAFARARRER